MANRLAAERLSAVSRPAWGERRRKACAAVVSPPSISGHGQGQLIGSYELESRMREIRQSGSEGGVALTRHSYPYRSAPITTTQFALHWSHGGIKRKGAFASDR